ncbi:sialic acid O-acetyltransferase [Algibacter sp. R77976]|uniref:PglD-related sugar-binding protein n=1 Tax=Algibacter sp. R77976 TaxID=3093873 RepID=UPI0037CA5BED
MKNAIIVGAGQNGQVYASYLIESGVNVIGYVDDAPSLQGKIFHNIPVIGVIKDLYLNKFKNKIQLVYCPIGVNSIRVNYLNLLKNEGYETPSFFHSSVSFGPNVSLGEAVYILSASVIMPHTTIGNHVMISSNSTVCHNTTLEDGVFVSSGVTIGAGINIRKKAFLGIGSIIMTGVREIGRQSIIGAGTVIIKNVLEYETMIGNPGVTLLKK